MSTVNAWEIAIAVALVISLLINVAQWLFGVAREVSHKLFVRSMDSIGESLAELSSAFAITCRQLEDDRIERRELKREMRESILSLNSTMEMKLQLAVMAMRQAGVNINNMQSDGGQAIQGKNEGGAHQDGN